MWPTLRFTFRTPAGFWFSLLLFSKVIVPSFRDAKSNDGHAKMRVAIPVYYGVVYCVYVNSVLDFLWDISLWKPGYLKVLFFLFSFFLFFFFLLESSVRSWRYIYIYIYPNSSSPLLSFSFFSVRTAFSGSRLSTSCKSPQPARSNIHPKECVTTLWSS